MKLNLALSVEHPGWGDCGDVCARAMQAALDYVQPELPGEMAEVSLVLGGDAAVQELNREWRGQDRPTNVLSFPAFDPDQPPPPGAPLLLGDIILAYETCVAEAARDRIPMNAHLGHLVVHGILHLLGYDHLAEDEAVEMETLEVAVLAQLGIANPYKDQWDE